MTEIKLNIETALFKSAVLCASKEEVRYYLKGVCVDPGQNVVNLVATDGHILFTAIHELNFDAGESLPHESFIIPTETIKRALTGYKGETVEITRAGDSWTFAGVVFQPIDGTYPNWRAVFPTADEVSHLHNKPANFNLEYLGIMSKISKTLKTSTVLNQLGERPAVVSFARSDCFALVMPMRETKSERTPESVISLLSTVVPPIESDKLAA